MFCQKVCLTCESHTNINTCLHGELLLSPYDEENGVVLRSCTLNQCPYVLALKTITYTQSNIVVFKGNTLLLPHVSRNKCTCTVRRQPPAILQDILIALPNQSHPLAVRSSFTLLCFWFVTTFIRLKKKFSRPSRARVPLIYIYKQYVISPIGHL